MECGVMIWAGGEKRLCYSVIMNSVRLAHSGASVCVCIGTLMEMKQSRWVDLSTWIFINRAADSNEHWTGGLGHTDHKVGASTRRGTDETMADSEKKLDPLQLRWGSETSTSVHPHTLQFTVKLRNTGVYRWLFGFVVTAPVHTNTWCN